MKFESSCHSCSRAAIDTVKPPPTNRRRQRRNLQLDIIITMPPPEAGNPAWQAAGLRSTTCHNEQGEPRDAEPSEGPTPRPKPEPRPSLLTPPPSSSRSWRGRLASTIVLVAVGLVVAAFIPVSFDHDNLDSDLHFKCYGYVIIHWTLPLSPLIYVKAKHGRLHQPRPRTHK